MRLATSQPQVGLSVICLEGAWGSQRYINLPPFRWRGCWSALYGPDLPVKAEETVETAVPSRGRKRRGSRGRRAGARRARGSQPRCTVAPSRKSHGRETDPRSRRQLRADAWILRQLSRYAYEAAREVERRRKAAEERAAKRASFIRVGGSAAYFDRTNKFGREFTNNAKVCEGRRKSITRRASLMRRQLEPGTFKNFRQLETKGFWVCAHRTEFKIRAKEPPLGSYVSPVKPSFNKANSEALFRGDPSGVPGGGQRSCHWRKVAEPGCRCRHCRSLREKHYPRGGKKPRR